MYDIYRLHDAVGRRPFEIYVNGAFANVDTD